MLLKNHLQSLLIYLKLKFKYVVRNYLTIISLILYINIHLVFIEIISKHLFILNIIC